MKLLKIILRLFFVRTEHKAEKSNEWNPEWRFHSQLNCPENTNTKAERNKFRIWIISFAFSIYQVPTRIPFFAAYALCSAYFMRKTVIIYIPHEMA